MGGSKYVACDFGAGSGRVILGELEHGKLSLREIHRFDNHEIQVFDRTYWDILALFQELKTGLRMLASQGHSDVDGIGVDTWGVDFGLMAFDGYLAGNPVSYRDSRTDGMLERAFQLMPKDEIYDQTGIQFMPLNTIFQLLSAVENEDSSLDIADTLLFMPDLFNYLLTGNEVTEYTIASTSQLLDAEERDWSDEIFERLALPLQLMADIVEPGTIIGELLPSIQKETGMGEVDIIAPACHDTASAVAAVPAIGDDWAYLSSGTWSLLGVELDEPIISKESLANNFTNEGGYGKTIRFLRNITGMWLLERCRAFWKQQGVDESYETLLALAVDSPPFKCFVNPDDPAFVNPANMPEALSAFCRRSRQPAPSTRGEFARCVLESLAMKYRFVVEMIESMRGSELRTLHVVGGGSQNRLLNQFTANALGIPVMAGPVEATAAGNILIQAIAKGDLAGLQEARQVVINSFELETFVPEDQEAWDEAYQRCKQFFQ